MKRPAGRSRPARRRGTQTSSRRRTHHPLDIRSWVVGKDPEDIRQTLAERNETIETALEAYQDTVTRLAKIFGAFAAELLTGRPSAPLSPDRLVHGRRLLAFHQVRSYYRQNPYRGKFLPRIADRGGPWDVLPDEIHILDLPSDVIRTGLQNAGPILASMERVFEAELDHEPKPSGVTPRLIVAALVDEIYAERAMAWWNPFVQVGILELLKTAHYSADLEERRQAADWLNEVFHAFMPDLTQHLERRDDVLMERLQQYEAKHAKVESVHRELKTLRRVTPALLARARQDIDPRLRKVELAAWIRKTASDVTLALLAPQFKITSATLSDQLTQARKARKIQDAWSVIRDELSGTSEPPDPLSTTPDHSRRPPPT